MSHTIEMAGVHQAGDLVAACKKELALEVAELQKKELSEYGCSTDGLSEADSVSPMSENVRALISPYVRTHHDLIAAKMELISSERALWLHEIAHAECDQRREEVAHLLSTEEFARDAIADEWALGFEKTVGLCYRHLLVTFERERRRRYLEKDQERTEAFLLEKKRVDQLLSSAVEHERCKYRDMYRAQLASMELDQHH